MPLILVGIFIKTLNCNSVIARNIMRLYISKSLLQRLLPGFIKHHIKNRFDWAKGQVAAERKAGNFVVLLSAGVDYFIIPVVRDMKFDLTVTSTTDKSRPWKIDFFCFGKNKVSALNRVIKSYHMVRSYSDSKSDMPVMNLADEQIWIKP